MIQSSNIRVMSSALLKVAKILTLLVLIKKKFNEIEVLKWGKIPDFDIVINATSVGLKGDSLDLDLKTKDKIFYDIIYNPKETQFLKKARENGNIIENGKLMFIYQANQSFSIWNNVIPKIDEEVLKILE